jgi:hypothetical protein
MVELGTSARIRPGIYFVHLLQGTHAALKRMVVVK